VKYMILIQSNRHFHERWEKLSDTEREEFGRRHYALNDELADSGELVISAALSDPSLSKRVTVRDSETMTTDGPFAEVKEHLAGFYLVDCDSEERALAIAAQVPDAVWGLVEVRPVLGRNGEDM
jgi:hypothetical protein